MIDKAAAFDTHRRDMKGNLVFKKKAGSIRGAVARYNQHQRVLMVLDGRSIRKSAL